MKEKTITRQLQIYVCDFCGKESSTKEEIARCEINHRCPHNSTKILIYHEQDGTFLLEECSQCHEHLGPWYCLDKLTDDKRRQVYDLVKRLSGEPAAFIKTGRPYPHLP